MQGSKGHASGSWPRLRAAWPLLRRVGLVAFLVGVVVLLGLMARTIEWGEVWQALRRYERGTLALAFGLCVLSHACYACYDLLGRAYTGHHLPARQVLGVTFISYAFNLNLGTLVGGLGLRMRLYTRLGLRPGTVARITGLAVVTNWLGYAAIAGLLFALQTVRLPSDWAIGNHALQVLGVGLLLLCAAYLAACGLLRRRAWKVRGHKIHLPHLPLAAGQVLLAGATWAALGGALYALMPHALDAPKVSYPQVLAVTLLAAVAGILTRVPAGLGVMEAVFVAILAAKLGRPSVLAAVLAYRALYYLVPLAVAAAAYAVAEMRVKQRPPLPGARPAEPRLTGSSAPRPSPGA